MFTAKKENFIPTFDQANIYLLCIKRLKEDTLPVVVYLQLAFLSINHI